MVLLSAKVHYVAEESKEKLKPSKKKSRKNQRPDIDLLHSDSLLLNLFPIDVEGEFLEKHFKQHPVVVRGNEDQLSIVKELLLNLDIMEVGDFGSINIDIQMLIKKLVRKFYRYTLVILIDNLKKYLSSTAYQE